jgi:hypothetical protein
VLQKKKEDTPHRLLKQGDVLMRGNEVRFARESLLRRAFRICKPKFLALAGGFSSSCREEQFFVVDAKGDAACMAAQTVRSLSRQTSEGY